MRTGAGLFGLLCGLVIILINARYGYRTTDEQADAYMVGFFYGAIAFAGLFGHAVAARLWKRGGRISALAVGIVCFVSLLVNLSNSLGAIAGRGDQTQAKRLQVADTVKEAKRSLQHAEDEREGLRFTPTDAAALQAAKESRDTASHMKSDECVKRGPKCEAREAEERKASEAFTLASTNKSTTDQARSLDLKIVQLRRSITEEGPVLAVNSQASALARLFALPDSSASFLSTVQSFAMGAIVELLAVVFLIAYEALDHSHGLKLPTEAKGRPEEAIDLLPVVNELVPVKVFPQPPKPRLIATEQNPFGNVTKIIAELLAVEKGERAEVTDIFASYARMCSERGLRPVPIGEFTSALKGICQKATIKIVTKGDHVYLNNMRLKTAAKDASAVD